MKVLVVPHQNIIAVVIKKNMAFAAIILAGEIILATILIIERKI